MNDEIRKKHEEYVKDVRKENRFIPSLLSCAEVDSLFRALDAEREKVERYEPIAAAVESHLERALQILKGVGDE